MSDELHISTSLSVPLDAVTQTNNIPLYELRWPIQFEPTGTVQTNDVIVLVDRWSLWESV
jgi:hypothetical protein